MLLFSTDLPRFFDLLPYSRTLTLFANVTDLSGEAPALNMSLLTDYFLTVLRLTGLETLSADLVYRFRRV